MAAEIKIVLEDGSGSGGGGGGGTPGGGGGTGGGGGGGPRLTPQQRTERDEERQRAREYATIQRSERAAAQRYAREQRDAAKAEQEAARALPLPMAREIREAPPPMAREIGTPQARLSPGERANRRAFESLRQSAEDRYSPDVDYVRERNEKKNKGGGFGPPGLLGKQFLANAIGTAVSQVGSAGAGLAQNSVMPGLEGAARSASLGLSALGPKGFIAASALQAVVAGITSFQATVNAFVARGKELSGLDSRLASATAQSEVIRLQSDLREARALGSQMSKLIEQQAKAEAAFREALLPIKEAVLNVLIVGMDRGLGLMIMMLEVMNHHLPAGAKIDGTLKAIRDILAGGGSTDIMTSWVDALGGFTAPLTAHEKAVAAALAAGVKPPPAPPAAGRPFGGV